MSNTKKSNQKKADTLEKEVINEDKIEIDQDTTPTEKVDFITAEKADFTNVDEAISQANSEVLEDPKKKKKRTKAKPVIENTTLEDVIATEEVKEEKTEVVDSPKENAPLNEEPTPKKKKVKAVKEEKPSKADLIPIVPEEKSGEALVLESEKTKARREQKEKAQLAKKEKRLAKMKKHAFEETKRTNKTYFRYDTDVEQGLSNEAVESRMLEGLVNNVKSGSTKSIKRIVISNVFTFFNLLTISIAVWLITVHAFTDLLFLVIVSLNMIIGICQEIRAKKTIDKLSLISAPTAVVRRDGDNKEISVKEVVLDDILLLETGKQICSDSIVVDGFIEVNESLLTGESDAILKKPGDTLFSGSFVVSGRCRARVDKVGRDNYIETLASQAKQYKKPKSDLMRTLNLIIRFMAVVIIPIGFFLFYMQYFVGGNEYVDAVRGTAGAMVGMIPSGLYLLTSIALAVGVIKLAQNNVLVQELYCIEMLARVNVLCLDKTGTITDGTMSVRSVAELNPVEGLSTRAVISAMLNALNDSNLTSVALEEYFGRGKRIKHLKTIPFSSSRKYSAVTFEKYGTFMLGAPEFILKDEYKTINKQVSEYASQGYRVLLLAHKKGTINDDKLPDGEIGIMSLILIEDNVRPDAVDTIGYFKRSGVEVKVISGDNPITVSKISERAGIVNADKFISLDGMDDEDVIRAASKYTVFGRVSPAQKKLLVQTLKSLGKVVAMTGDGVNDILALKEADCSIAVASGSEAARNVSHLVLLDSNFSSMPKVVAEGRRVINNVANVASLFLTKTIFSFLLSIQALNSGGVYPITTLQLSIIDFLCIGIPSFVLVLEPNNREVDGNFFINILKGAIPGALVILINSITVFSLVEILNLSQRASSTIIVITATHTCLMVLFKVCKPFNLMRKCLCGGMYALFVIIVCFVPNFFKLSPLVSFADYYDSTLKIETVRDWLDVDISIDGKYVIDGYVTEYVAPQNTNTFKISSTDTGYLIVNGTTTNYKIQMPNLSTTADGFFVIEGTVTSYAYADTIVLSVNSAGDISYKANSADAEWIDLNYNILPVVTTSKDGKYVINGEITTVSCEEIIKSIAINSNYELVINGKTIAYTSNGETLHLGVSVPTISKNTDNYLVIGGTDTTFNVSSCANDYSPAITISTDKYLFNGVETSISILVPSLTVSEADHYIINNMYSDYIATGNKNEIIQTISSDGYFEINNTKTNIKPVLEQTVGGQVPHLPLAGLLLMFTLCLMAAPLMKIIENIIPWSKRQLKNIQTLISKM